MDIRLYFEKVREIENAISTDFAVVSSLETADGGKPGTLTEVSRSMAARLLTEGKARLATEEESQQFFKKAEEARTAVELALAGNRVQFVAVSEHDAKSLRRQKG